MSLVKSTLDTLRAKRAAGTLKTGWFSAFGKAQLDAIEAVLALIADAEARGDGKLPEPHGPELTLLAPLELFDRVRLLVATQGIPAGTRGAVVDLYEPEGCMVEFFADNSEQETIDVIALDRRAVALIAPEPCAETIRELCENGSPHARAFVEAQVQESPGKDSLKALVADLIAQHGEPSADDRLWAERVLREARERKLGSDYREGRADQRALLEGGDDDE